MKLFTPIYASALALAVSLGAFEQAAADCTETCTTGCTDLPVQKSAPSDAITKLSDSGSACAQGTFAYLTSLAVTGATGDTPTVAFTGVTDAQVTAAVGACPTEWANLGATATSDVSFTVACTESSTTSCAFKYKAVWACTTAPAKTCADECGTNDGCTAITVPKATPTPITKPTTPVCATGTHAYLSSLVVMASDSSTIAVTFDNSLTAPTADTTCATKWSNPIGASATTDVSFKIACSTDPNCAVKYKAAWTCSTAAGSTDTTNSTNTTAPTTTTVAPTPTPSTTSGFAVLGGATPVALAVALVAVVGGINFAMPV